MKTVFLNGILEDVYLEQPEGFNDDGDRVCFLKKSLCGLKQAPQYWNKRFAGFVVKARFQNSTADPCLFYCKHKNKGLYVAIYVNDSLIVDSNRKEIAEFLKTLEQEFSTTTGSLDISLDLKIKEHENGSTITKQ